MKKRFYNLGARYLNIWGNTLRQFICLMFIQSVHSVYAIYVLGMLPAFGIVLQLLKGIEGSPLFI